MKTDSVQFNNWHSGQKNHPISGFGLLQNVEVFENRGLAKITNRGNFQYTPTSLPIAEVKNGDDTYTLTGETAFGGTGTLYKNGTAIQTNINTAYDLVVWKDYIWVSSGGSLNAYGPLSNSPQWFAGLTALNSNYYNKLLVGQDDILYCASGNLLKSVTINSSGTPGVAPFINVNTALDLPEGQFISCLCEYGRYIAMGTGGGTSWVNRTSSDIARMYVWDRVSASFSLPVIFKGENGVNAIESYANRLYVQAGTQGNIYETDSTQYRKIATLPYAPTGFSSNSLVYPNAMVISPKGNLLVGLSVFGDGYAKGGVYEVSLSEGYPVQYRTVYTGFTGDTAQLRIGLLRSISYQKLRIGWNTGGVSTLEETDQLLSDNCIIETDLRRVGTVLNKKTFQHISWTLAEPLVSGQFIRIYYRKNNKESWTLINTWDYTDVGGVLELEDKALITDAIFVQLKVQLSQSQNTFPYPYGSNVYLVDINLW